jgi:2-succinyl-6-hydroxy-2,4-cyclohexadiene-1-carboxylate synthase
MKIHIHIARQGTTPRYLFIHGLFGSATDWRELIQALPSECGVLVLNLPGHGGAAPLAPSLTTFDACIDTIAQSLREQVEEPIRGVGYSLGGRVLLGLWQRLPELFRDLCLISTFPGFEAEEERRTRAIVDREWIERLKRLPSEEFFGRWYAQEIFVRSGWSPELEERIRMSRAGIRAVDVEPIFAATSVAQMPSFWDALSTTSTPVRYVVGERDRKYLQIAQGLQARNPTISVSVVQGAGHMVPFERPHEVANILKYQ